MTTFLSRLFRRAFDRRRVRSTSRMSNVFGVCALMWHPSKDGTLLSISRRDQPPWLAVWLLIIADNTLHLICNAAALKWL